jgi:hypothetical protein
MADLEEEKFRIEFEKTAKKLGWSTYHVSGSDGIHDELMYKKNIGVTLELKAIKPNKFNHSIRNSFKSTQMPFYLTQIAESGTPTWIGVKFLDVVPFYGIFALDSTKEIIDFFSKKWKDVAYSDYSGMNNIQRLLECLI